MNSITPFHLAIQVRDLKEAREFYRNTLGCLEGRSSTNWVDLNLYGHQLVCHVNPEIGPHGKVSSYTNAVDNQTVPIPHFGVVLEMPVWQHLADRLKEKKIDFLVEPYTRFKGEAGEQATLFLMDPSGNAIEFKAFNNIKKQLFET